MKIAVRYQSRGGNTKAAAQAIAAAAGTVAHPITTPIDETVDLLFVGGGIYAFGIDAGLKDFVANLEPAKVKSLAAFAFGGTSYE